MECSAANGAGQSLQRCAAVSVQFSVTVLRGAKWRWWGGGALLTDKSYGGGGKNKQKRMRQKEGKAERGRSANVAQTDKNKRLLLPCTLSLSLSLSHPGASQPRQRGRRQIRVNAG